MIIFGDRHTLVLQCTITITCTAAFMIGGLRDVVGAADVGGRRRTLGWLVMNQMTLPGLALAGVVGNGGCSWQQVAHMGILCGFVLVVSVGRVVWAMGRKQNRWIHVWGLRRHARRVLRVHEGDPGNASV